MLNSEKTNIPWHQWKPHLNGKQSLMNWVGNVRMRMSRPDWMNVQDENETACRSEWPVSSQAYEPRSHNGAGDARHQSALFLGTIWGNLPSQARLNGRGGMKYGAQFVLKNFGLNFARRLPCGQGKGWEEGGSREKRRRLRSCKTWFTANRINAVSED